MAYLHKLQKLIELSKEILSTHNKFDRIDLAGRMITYFMHKQLDHAISVTKLDPSMDIILIARTMIEGVGNLTWALEDKGKRVRDWFDYSAVYDYELLERKDENGSYVSQADRTDVGSAFKNLGQTFLTKRGNRHHDNFRRGVTIADTLKSDPNIRYLYAYFSDWVHWGSQSLRTAMHEENTCISYYETNHPYRIPALMTAFNCLHIIFDIANDHFKLGFDTKLQVAKEDFISLAKALSKSS